MILQDVTSREFPHGHFIGWTVTAHTETNRLASPVYEILLTLASD